MKDVSTEQAKIIKKMVLDKKTNKEIAETTGLKYWEVRDYIQYIGLAGIREEMFGRKPGRRKKDGYNKGKDGPNADMYMDLLERKMNGQDGDFYNNSLRTDCSMERMCDGSTSG